MWCWVASPEVAFWFFADFNLLAETMLGGKYEVKELLGRGGNGVTYLCRNVDTGGDVAVKCLSLRRCACLGGAYGQAAPYRRHAPGRRAALRGPVRLLFCELPAA